jgi:ubiquitin-protein ligase
MSYAKAYLEEMRLMIARPHEAMDVYVNESNMSFWKIIMSGPSASPYERGTFVLTVEMPSNYPQRAPTVRFITPILHPNVTKARLSPNN